MLGDRDTAADLLRSAWEIDPQSKEVADAFRRLGLIGPSTGEWIEPSRASASADVDPAIGPRPSPASVRS